MKCVREYCDFEQQAAKLFNWRSYKRIALARMRSTKPVPTSGSLWKSSPLPFTGYIMDVRHACILMGYKRRNPLTLQNIARQAITDSILPSIIEYRSPGTKLSWFNDNSITMYYYAGFTTETDGILLSRVERTNDRIPKINDTQLIKVPLWAYNSSQIRSFHTFCSMSMISRK